MFRYHQFLNKNEETEKHVPTTFVRTKKFIFTCYQKKYNVICQSLNLSLMFFMNGILWRVHTSDSQYKNPSLGISTRAWNIVQLFICREISWGFTVMIIAKVYLTKANAMLASDLDIANYVKTFWHWSVFHCIQFFQMAIAFSTKRSYFPPDNFRLF